MDTAVPRVQPQQVERDTGRKAPSDVQALCDASAADLVSYLAGDQAALDRLVRRLTPMLWHVVRAYGLDTPAAEDVVQSTWLALVRRGDAIDDPQAVVRWLTVTARREAWRLAKEAGRVETTDVDVLDLRESPQESPEQQAIRAGTADALWEAVAALTPRCQRLLRIVAFAERPNYAAVSEALQIPMGSIGPTRARCLLKLRAVLESRGWRLA